MENEIDFNSLELPIISRYSLIIRLINLAFCIFIVFAYIYTMFFFSMDYWLQYWFLLPTACTLLSILSCFYIATKMIIITNNSIILGLLFKKEVIKFFDITKGIKPLSGRNRSKNFVFFLKNGRKIKIRVSSSLDNFFQLYYCLNRIIEHCSRATT